MATYPKIETIEKDLIHDVLKFISIPSVKAPPLGDMPFGKPINDALNFYLDLGKSMGFKTLNVDNYGGHIEYGTGRKCLGVLGHVDVVPAGNGWHYPPFEGTLKEGRIYGRGAVDDKGPMLAALYALKLLKDEGFVPKKKIRLIVGTDEESGWGGINYYFKKEKKPHLGFTPDAAFPLVHGEKGICNFDFCKTFSPSINDGGVEVIALSGGNAANSVPDYAKVILNIKDHPVKAMVKSYQEKGYRIEAEEDGDDLIVHSYGLSAHGSMPSKGHNAISQLILFLHGLDLEIGDLATFIRFYALNIGMSTDGAGLKINMADTYGPLTFNVGKISLDQKQGQITVNMRYPITYKKRKMKNADKIKKLLSERLHAFGIRLENWKDKPPILTKPTDPLVTSLMAIYKDHTNNPLAQPFTIGGGTYARAFKNCVAFGPVFPNREDVVHQADEYISLEDLLKATAIYYDAIKALSM